MFRVVPPPIIRSAYNCIYSICICHTVNATCRYRGRVGRFPRWRQVTVTVWQTTDAVGTVVCAPDDGWRYYPKHVERFPDINKLCNAVSCWIYIGIFQYISNKMHGPINVKFTVIMFKCLYKSQNLGNICWCSSLYNDIVPSINYLCEFSSSKRKI